MHFIAWIFSLAVLAFFLFAWAQIFKKAGYSGWMCLLLIIPIINLIAFLWFAFTTWPVQEKVVVERPQNRLPF